jgi:hypothetical protein
MKPEKHQAKHVGTVSPAFFQGRNTRAVTKATNPQGSSDPSVIRELMYIRWAHPAMSRAPNQVV